MSKGHYEELCRESEVSRLRDETSVDGTMCLHCVKCTDRVSPPPPPTKRNDDVDVDDDGGPKTFVSSRSDIIEEI